MLLPNLALETLLQGWRQQLSSWARSGDISRAAREALQLQEEPDLLQLLIGRWERGNFEDLPPIEVLPAASMAAAAGAYALSTGTIYLNADWLLRASREQALAVLSEELGHHLDGLLNPSDTPGDEGALFAALLLGGGGISEAERQVLRAQDDRGRVLVAGRELEVEQAARVVTTPIPQTYPRRTGGEIRNIEAFAALKSDGSVVTWGYTNYGGDSSAVADELGSGVGQIFSTYYAFAALKRDGSVVTWGVGWGGGDSSGVASQLGSGVVQIFSTEQAFAALKKDGSVVTWGGGWWGGDSSGVASQLGSGVEQIFSNAFAFAALKSDGSVVTWGYTNYGGDIIPLSDELGSGVEQIFSTALAFAALKRDGSVVTWGGGGGDSSGVASQLGSGVVQIFSTDQAFAALKKDGSVVTWGNSGSGGDSSAVASQLRSGVEQIFSTPRSFAALKSDGSVVTWGSFYYGGGDSSSVASQLNSGVEHIFSTEYAFAALKSDGSVVTWGNSLYGGDSNVVASQLSSGVEQIFSTSQAFAALKSDGSVVSWGNTFYGGDSSAVASQLQSGVVGFANPFTDDRLITSETLPSPIKSVDLSEDNYVDGLLDGSRWDIKPGDSKLIVSFGFPSSINDYEENYNKQIIGVSQTRYSMGRASRRLMKIKRK